MLVVRLLGELLVIKHSISRDTYSTDDTLGGSSEKNGASLRTKMTSRLAFVGLAAGREALESAKALSMLLALV